jgi:pimeloyl-ACP methyl ester carboxylesterase
MTTARRPASRRRWTLASVVRGGVATVASGVILAAVGYVILARSGQFQLTRDDLRERYTDSASRFVTVRDMEVHYKDEGAGPVILLMHGSFGSLRSWDGVVERLKGKYRLIRPDQPPLALSGDLPASAKGLALEDYVAALLDGLGIDHAVIVGTSSGGIIAYRFAAKYPGRTDALIVANAPSAVVDNSATGSPALLEALIWINTNVLKHQPRLYWKMFLESLFADPTRLTDAAIERYFDFGRRPRTSPAIPSMMSRVNDTGEIDQVLGRVRAPTLLVWGVPDRVLPEPMAHQLKAKLTAAPVELVILNGTGHYPPDESPDLVAAEIDRFLTATLPQINGVRLD